MTAWLFYITTISFATGIFLRSFFTISYDHLVICLLGSSLLAFMWMRSRKPRALAASVALLFLVVGVVRFDATTWDESVAVLDARVGYELEFTGTVVREPDVRERTTHLYVKLANPEQIILLYADRTTPVRYGDVIAIAGELQRPEAFKTDLGRTFNYPGYLKARGVSHVMFYPEIKQIGSEEGNPVLAMLLTFKLRFMNSVERLIPEPQAGLGEGLLLGVKSALGDELEMVFRRTGIIHIVVLSGYNVMLVVVFVMTVLSYFVGHRLRLPFGLVAIATFALLVGLSATVVRASIMAGLILVARATGQSYGVMRALMFAGVVMLLVNPYLLVFDPGFQLSFVATLGLILLAPQLEHVFQRVPSMIGIREFLVATIATQIFVLPLLLYQIGEFSVVSVLVNVLVLPMVPVAMLLTFISGMFGFISTTAALPFAYLTHLSLSYILTVATWFAALPFAAFVVPPFPFMLMVLMYIALGYIVWRLLVKQDVARTAVGDVVALDGWTIEDETAVKEKTEPLRNSSAKGSSFFQ